MYKEAYRALYSVESDKIANEALQGGPDQIGPGVGLGMGERDESEEVFKGVFEAWLAGRSDTGEVIKMDGGGAVYLSRHSDPVPVAMMMASYHESYTREYQKEQREREAYLKVVSEKPLRELIQIDGLKEHIHPHDKLDPDKNGLTVWASRTKEFFNAPWLIRLLIHPEADHTDVNELLDSIREMVAREAWPTPSDCSPAPRDKATGDDQEYAF